MPKFNLNEFLGLSSDDEDVKPDRNAKTTSTKSANKQKFNLNNFFGFQDSPQQEEPEINYEELGLVPIKFSAEKESVKSSKPSSRKTVGGKTIGNFAGFIPDLNYDIEDSDSDDNVSAEAPASHPAILKGMFSTGSVKSTKKSLIEDLASRTSQDDEELSTDDEEIQYIAKKAAKKNAKKSVKKSSSKKRSTKSHSQYVNELYGAKSSTSALPRSNKSQTDQSDSSDEDDSDPSSSSSDSETETDSDQEDNTSSNQLKNIKPKYTNLTIPQPVAIEKVKKERFDYRNIISDALINGDIKIDNCDLSRLLYNAKYLTSKEKHSATDSILIMGKLNYKMLEKPKNSLLDFEDPKEYREKLVKKADNDVIVKLGFAPNREDGPGHNLIFESQLYTKVISKLPDWGYTPHVMLPITSYYCDDFMRKLQSVPDAQRNVLLKEIGKIKTQYTRSSYVRAIGELDAKLQKKSISQTEYKKQKEKLDRSKYDLDFTKAQLLILERGKGENLHEWMRHNKLDDNFLSIMFQIMWTLEVFNRIGIRHNDIHFGNVWIDKLDKPRYFIYFLDDETYFAVPVYHVVKIFDFDRAGIWSEKFKDFDTDEINADYLLKQLKTDGTGKLEARYFTLGKKLHNGDLHLRGLCKDFGECNDRNTKRDAFQVLSSAYDRVPDGSKWEDWILKFFRGSKSLLDKQLPAKGYLCNVVRGGNCNGDYVPTDYEMMNNESILRTGFTKFLHKLPEYDARLLPENDFTRIYYMPTVNERSLDANLSYENIRNIPLNSPESILNV
jgi:hypothetical protein